MILEVWTLRRQPNELDPCAAEQFAEGRGEQRIPVVDEVRLASQKAAELIEQRSRSLLHPHTIGLRCQPSEFDTPGSQIQDEEET